MRLSASRLSVLQECQWWARPEVVAPADNEIRPSAQTGKRFHSLVDCALSGGEPEQHEGADEEKAQKWLARWRTWWPEFSGGLPWRSEVVYLYDYATGEVEEKERGWANTKRERAPTQIPVILDLIAIDGNTAHIADYKTGKKVEPASVNIQLLTAALAVAKHHPIVSQFKLSLLYSRIRDPFVVDSAEVTLLDVLDFERQLSGWVGDIPISVPKPGDHCFRCSARRDVCPAFQEPDRAYGAQESA